MTSNTKKEEWDTYCKKTLAELSPLIEKLGYTLDTDQPHLMGERFIIRPISGGRKLVLIGRRSKDDEKVVIKVSNEQLGIKEIEHERICRNTLGQMPFAYQIFRLPKELAFVKSGDFTIAITEFITQDRPFLARPIEEEFTLALAAFKAQEGAHATTYKHQKLVTKTFGEIRAADYYKKIQQYAQDIIKLIPNHKESYPELGAALARASTAIANNQERIDQYGGFLTHWDFIPQNFRIHNNNLYLLDHSSLRFGNKYESWARFINFMVLYNTELARALLTYVSKNRTSEESESLKLMRIFRLVELIRFYTTWLPNTSGDLQELTKARIWFWTNVLYAVLDDKEISQKIIETYTGKRDALRTDDELHRQKDLH